MTNVKSFQARDCETPSQVLHCMVNENREREFDQVAVIAIRYEEDGSPIFHIQYSDMSFMEEAGIAALVQRKVSGRIVSL